jgi:hypothetical protein
MISSADLFTFTLLATGGLYACLLAYFKTSTSAHRLEIRAYPLDHDTAAYILNRIQNRPDRCRGRAGYLIGTGNLLVIYIYLMIELSRHDLPKIGYWGIAALAAAAVICTTATVVMWFSSQTMDLELYRDALATL